MAGRTKDREIIDCVVVAISIAMVDLKDFRMLIVTAFLAANDPGRSTDQCSICGEGSVEPIMARHDCLDPLVA